MHILLLGGSGFIGTALCDQLKSSGHSVTVLSRSAAVDQGAAPCSQQPPLKLADTSALAPAADTIGHYPSQLGESVAKADAIINLAGQSILTTPWHKAGKLAILNSRVEPALAAVHALLACRDGKPRSYIQASGSSFYGDSTELKDEDAPEGEGFLAHVCSCWEAPAAALVERAAELQLPIRVATLRIGMVLGAKAQSSQLLAKAARLRLAGSLRHNPNWQSAIAISDLCRLLEWLATTESAEGIYNGVSPEPFRMAQLLAALEQRFGYQLPLPHPPLELIKKLAGFLAIDKAAIITDQLRLVPKRALAGGFRFHHDQPWRLL